MRGILLCGGHGTRLRPLTYYCNKHLLPIYWKNHGIPIIELAIKQLANLGVKDIAVILGDFRAEDIITFLHKRKEYVDFADLNFTYYFQGEPLGIAHAVAQAKDFLKDEKEFYVMLGDNIFSRPITLNFAVPLDKPLPLCTILFAQVKNPCRFGSPEFGSMYNDKFGCLMKIVEKPARPQTDLALTGAYRFNTKFYFDAYSKLEPSEREEYELTDIINMALKENPDSVLWTIYDGFWSDAGTFESIYQVQKKLNEEQT